MLFDSSPKIGINAKISTNDVTPSTVSIFGTAQMIEARKLSYEGFVLADLRMQACRILRNQMYIIYHIGLTRYMMQHTVGANFVKKFYFDVTPESFTPDSKEISLYLSNPKFLWRFSAWNYNAMIHMFDPKHRSKHMRFGFKTYNEDDSPVMSYVESRNTRIINNLKLNFNKLELITYEPYNFEKFEIVQSYFTFKLNKYEQTEIYFSDDYFLHQLDAKTTYDEYVHLLITGDCRRYPSDLLLRQIDVKNENLNKKKEKSFFKKVNKRLSTASNHKTLLKFMSSKIEKSDPAIIAQLADLVAYNRQYIKVENPLITNPRWVNECYMECLTPVSIFYWYIYGIFGNDCLIEEETNSIVGAPWDVNIEPRKMKWLLKQFINVTSNFKWLYDLSLREQHLLHDVNDLNKELIHLINLYRKVALSIDVKQFPSPKKLRCFETYDCPTESSYVLSSSMYSSIRSAGSKTLSLKRLFAHKNEDGPLRVCEPLDLFTEEPKQPANDKPCNIPTSILKKDVTNSPAQTLESLTTTAFQKTIKNNNDIQCEHEYDEDDENSMKKLSRTTTRRSTRGFHLELRDIKEEIDEDFSVDFNTAYAQAHLQPSVHVIKSNFLSVYEFSNNKVVQYKKDILSKMLLLRDIDEKENFPVVPTSSVKKKQIQVPDNYVHPLIINVMHKHLGYSHPSIALLDQGNKNAWRELEYRKLMAIVIDLVYKQSRNCLNTKPLMHLLYDETGRFGVEPSTFISFHDTIIHKLKNRYENITNAINSAMKKFKCRRNVNDFPNAPRISANFNIVKYEETRDCHVAVITYFTDYFLANHPGMKFMRSMLWTVHFILGSTSQIKKLMYAIARDIHLSELFERCKYFSLNTNWSYEHFNFDRSNQEMFESYQLFEPHSTDDSESKLASSSEESLQNNLSLKSD